jgi:membrane-bound lytic murein transglycosylase D
MSIRAKIIYSWYQLLLLLILLSIVVIFSSSASYASATVEGIQIYQKNLHLSAEHKQKLADDITRYRNADNIWDVLREEFSLQHNEDNPIVQEKIEWFMSNQDFLLRSALRATPYLYYISQQLKKRHLPMELVLLPIIESGYNPFSLSTVGAAGIWQLMPDTASGLGVKQDWWFDGRRDVITSTRAALNYLAYLQSFFDGNWLYAIAAYNTGEGNVLSAIKRNIRDGKDTDFWSLPVAQQTKDYVPSLLALAIIISHPDRYPIYFPPVKNAPYLAQVDIGAQINLKYAATLAGISYKQLIQLNPGFTRTLTSSKGPYKLVLPIENIEQFTENFSRSSTIHHPVNWIHYKVKSGDTLASISKKFSTTITSIRQLNHLSKNTLTHATNLLIPIHDANVLPTKPISEILTVKNTDEMLHIKQKTSIVDNKQISARTPNMNIELNSVSKKYVLQPGDTIYMVRTQDTLTSIAKHFHLNTYVVQAANEFNNSALLPGKQIIIPTHLNLKNSIHVNNRNSKRDILYVVRKGDTIEKIAKKFNTKPAAIRLANLMEKNFIQEDDRLLIPAVIRG